MQGDKEMALAITPYRGVVESSGYYAVVLRMESDNRRRVPQQSTYNYSILHTYSMDVYLV